MFPKYWWTETRVAWTSSVLSPRDWLLITIGHVLVMYMKWYIVIFFSRYYNKNKWKDVAGVAEFSLLWRLGCEVKVLKQNICLKLHKIKKSKFCNYWCYILMLKFYWESYKLLLMSWERIILLSASQIYIYICIIK